jgi:hypothetical protein
MTMSSARADIFSAATTTWMRPPVRSPRRFAAVKLAIAAMAPPLRTTEGSGPVR